MKMKVNMKLLPIKAHYFAFLGSLSPVLPFLIVVGQQLGIPVSVMGTLWAVSLLLVVLLKPALAALADIYPSWRRIIFLLTLLGTAICLSSIGLVPPLRGVPRLEGFAVQAQHVSEPLSPAAAAAAAATTTQVPLVPDEEHEELGGTDSSGLSLLLAVTDDGGGCYVAVAWDCVALCDEPWSCANSTTTTATTPTMTATLQPHNQDLRLTQESQSALSLPSSLVLHAGEERRHLLYKLEGAGVSDDFFPGNLSLQCKSLQWEGTACEGVWHYWQFWVLTLLLISANVALNTAISVTDAIIVDIVGKDGDYGMQRAWGTVGWGLMGPVSGLLVDMWSGTNITKDYMPAFAICFLLGSSDVILSAATIKVPEIHLEHNLFKVVWPLIQQPRFFIFCVFVVLNGFFDAVVIYYIFVMQEDMAKGTSIMAYMKLLQGLTLFVECGVEAPFMFINNWFMKTMGPQYVISMVFFLYIFRIIGLALVGAYGPVWATLIIETLNGPCFGLGYTATIVYASKLAPPGTSTTVQSVVSICYESIGYAAASYIGGILYSYLGGPRMYMAVGIFSVVIFLLHALSLKLLPPPPHESGEETISMAKQGGKEEEKQLNPDPEANELNLHESSSLAVQAEGEEEPVEAI